MLQLEEERVRTISFFFLSNRDYTRSDPDGSASDSGVYRSQGKALVSFVQSVTVVNKKAKDVPRPVQQSLKIPCLQRQRHTAPKH